MDAGGYGMPQSRARGLTRAILDTFPIVKFGSGLPQYGADSGGNKDAEVASSVHGMGMEMEMSEWEVKPTAKREELTIMTTMNNRHSIPGPSGSNPPSPTTAKPERAVDRRASGLTIPPPPSPDQQETTAIPRLRPPPLRDGKASVASSPTVDVVPAAIGRETCPICIVDFEEGDDLRVLPCEGKHRFHQACVDPWLLELSSSCPICREGPFFAGFCICVELNAISFPS
jgi:hypothetical protein